MGQVGSYDHSQKVRKPEWLKCSMKAEVMMNLMGPELVRLEKGNIKILPTKMMLSLPSGKSGGFFRSFDSFSPLDLWRRCSWCFFNWVAQSSNHETKQPSTEAHVYTLHEKTCLIKISVFQALIPPKPDTSR